MKRGRPPSNWVSTKQALELLSCSRTFLMARRSPLFKGCWRIMDPTAARPTYQWNKSKLLKLLEKNERSTRRS